jgi:hypothetical protein
MLTADSKLTNALWTLICSNNFFCNQIASNDSIFDRLSNVLSRTARRFFGIILGANYFSILVPSLYFSPIGCHCHFLKDDYLFISTENQNRDKFWSSRIEKSANFNTTSRAITCHEDLPKRISFIVMHFDENKIIPRNE